MNSDRIKGDWTQLKGKIKEKWGKLTDDDLDVIAGRTEQLVGRLQERYGLQRDQAEREADMFYDNLEREEEPSTARDRS